MGITYERSKTLLGLPILSNEKSVSAVSSAPTPPVLDAPSQNDLGSSFPRMQGEPLDARPGYKLSDLPLGARLVFAWLSY